MSRNIIIVGSAGSGKSTIARNIIGNSKVQVFQNPRYMKLDWVKPETEYLLFEELNADDKFQKFLFRVLTDIRKIRTAATSFVRPNVIAIYQGTKEDLPPKFNRPGIEIIEASYRP